MVGIDASKPGRLGAVDFLKLDHRVHHLLDREVASVVAEGHVRLGDLLALAVDPDTGEGDLRADKGRDVQLLLGEWHLVVQRLVIVCDVAVVDVDNLGARVLESVEEWEALDRWLVSVHIQNERHVLVECIRDTLRAGPGQDNVVRVDVSTVVRLLLDRIARQRASRATSKRHGRARKNGTREWLARIVLKNRKKSDRKK